MPDGVDLTGGQRSRVLIVDDEPQVLVALEDVLSESFEVLTAASPERALRVLEVERDIAVVVSDQRMPGMTGDELFSLLSNGCSATRVMVTGYADLSAVIRAVNHGRIFAYVTKPWDANQLNLTVHKSVEHFELTRRLEQERQLLEDLMNNIPDAIYFKDRNLRFTRINQACAERVDVADATQVSGKRLTELGLANKLASTTEEQEAVVLASGRTLTDIISEQPVAGVLRFYSTTIAPVRLRGGPMHGLVGISRDITARMATESALRRLTRVRTMLGAVNGAILQVKDREGLLQECCRIAVDDGGLLSAMALVEDDQRRRFRIAGARGVSAELGPSLVNLARAFDNADGSGMPLRGGQPVILSDLVALSAADPTHQVVLAGGSAVGAFPLVLEGDVAGALVFVARQADLFDGEEVGLLAELAHNVAIALDRMDKGARLNFLAYYDELTGLPKRGLFMDRVRQLLAERGDSGPGLAVLLIDLSRFRQVNDTLGRTAGDDLLQQVGKRFSELLGKRDTLARMEGSAFAALLAAPGSETELGTWVGRNFLEAINVPFTVRGTEIRLAARVGVAMSPSDGVDADSLGRNAEAALANARATGQRCVFYAPRMNERVGEKLSLETRLRRAVELNEFVLDYQPKVDLRSGAVVGLEALLRWKDPQRGLVPPAQFIPALEETGLILDVGAWVLCAVLQQCAEWLHEGLPCPRVAANVSSIQLADRGFLRSVERALDSFPTARGVLDLEITESVLMQDLVGNTEKLRHVKEHGVSIAIDDFGTGYSSLGYLSRLPIDALKIDRSFVNRMSDDPQDMTIVTTIISLAHSLDKKVIAEGVETGDQARLLKLVRCDQIQGYLVGRPQSSDDVKSLFRTRIRTWPPPAE